MSNPIFWTLLSSVQFSRSVVSDSLRPHEPQYERPPCPSPAPGVHPNPCLSSQWCHPTIILCRPLLLLPSIFPSIKVFSNESPLCIRWPKYWSFTFNISPSNEHPGLISFRMDWLHFLAVQGTQESTPAPQFESIRSVASSPLYGPTLTSIHDYWKNYSFDYTNLCLQSDAKTLTCSYKWQKASGSMGHRDSKKIIKDSILIASNMLATSYLWLLDWNVNELKWNLN